MTLAELNVLESGQAIAEFLRCCGSKRWARRMAEQRPFASEAAMADIADDVWTALDRDDWLEAFASHPVIGDTGSGEPKRKLATADWSDQEQAGMQSADDAVRARLARGNRDYRARFGYIFIVCATGKSAAEMLALLASRLTNDPARELAIAAEEQRKIMRLRLTRVVAG